MPKFNINWDEEILGEEPDIVVAARLQVSTRSVQKHRCRRGIPPCPPELPIGGKRGTNWDKEPLGKVPDEVLARKHLTDPRNVSEARRSRGIPAYSKTNRDKRLAGSADACIDKAILLPPSQVPEKLGELVALMTDHGWSVIFTP